MKKATASLLLVLAMCISLCTPARASSALEDTSSPQEPYEDVKCAFGSTALSIIEDTETRRYF